MKGPFLSVTGPATGRADLASAALASSRCLYTLDAAALEGPLRNLQTSPLPSQPPRRVLPTPAETRRAES